MLVGAHDGAIEHDGFKISILAEALEQPFPDPLLGPAREARERGMPVAKLRGQVAPGRPRAPDPQHRLQQSAVVLGSDAAITRLAGEKILDPSPLVIP